LIDLFHWTQRVASTTAVVFALIYDPVAAEDAVAQANERLAEARSFGPVAMYFSK